MGLDKDVLMTLSARDEDLMRKLEQQERKYDKLKAQLGELKNAGKAATKETGGAFEEMTQSMVRAATGVLSVSAAFGALKKSIDDARQTAAAAGQRIVDAASGRRALLQIATNDQEFQRMTGAANRLREKQGMNAAEAYQTVFNAESAGLGGNVQFFGKLRQINFDPSTAINAVQKVQSAFGGESGGGTPRQIIEKVLAAAKNSPVQAQDIARAASVASASFAGIGGGDEELLATLSRLSEPFKTPEQAAEKIKSLSDQLFKKRGQIKFAPGEEGLQGLDLISALPRLADEGKLRDESGKKRLDVKKFLSESNAIVAMQQINKDRDIINQRLADVNAAQATANQPDSLLNRRIAIAERDQTLRAVTLSEREKQSRESSEEGRYAVPAKVADAIRDQIVAAMEKAGSGSFSIGAAKSAMAVERYFKGDQSFVAGISSGGVTTGGVIVKFDSDLQEAIKAISRAAGTMQQAAEKMERSASKSPAGPTLSQPNSETGRPPVR